jgi:hypothetical protein
LFPPANLSRITAIYTQVGPVYTTDTLDSLKPNLVVTAYYSNGTSNVVTIYSLSGTLSEGISTITATYGGKSATFTVEVSEPEIQWDYEWNYTDGLPNDNGMTLANSGANTINMTGNGLSVVTQNSSSSNVIYKLESIGGLKTQVISELVFEITAFTAQSGGGIRHYAGLGGSGATALKIGQFLVAEDGIKYLTTSSGWATLYSATFLTNTEYKMRIVQVANNADVYINGLLVGSLQTFSENVAYPQFTAHRGVSVLFKSYKLKWTA